MKNNGRFLKKVRPGSPGIKDIELEATYGADAKFSDAFEFYTSCYGSRSS